MVFTKIYGAPPVCRKEIIRYTGCKSESDLPVGLLSECINTAAKELSYKVCYLVLDVKSEDNICDFGAFKVKSESLFRNLKDCKKAVLFAATVGVGIDRLIAKHGTLSPAKALIFNAIGTERIEALCDMFCEETEKEYGFLRPRFSPGYGDFDLSCQKDIFSLLNCQKHIGVTVTESLIMSPSKSVTAITGIGKANNIKNLNKCEKCENKECSYKE